MLAHTITRPSEPPTFTVAVDPGVSYAGLAVFQEKGLIHGSKVAIDKRRNICNQAEALASAVYREVLSALPRHVPPGRVHCDVLVEGQQTRRGKNQKGDQNVLLQLALNSGFILSKLKIRLDADAYWVPPTTWKGTIDKKIKLAQIRSVLTEQEKQQTAKNEHTLDAAGVGLWWLKRLT